MSNNTKNPSKEDLFKTLLKKLYQHPITKRNSNIFLGYLLGISLLEILAYTQGGLFSVIASRVWLFTGILCFAVFLCSVVMQIVSDMKEKKFFVSIGYLLLIAFLFYFIGNVGYSDINADAAQQVAAGLNSFKASDWNYTGIAFLGYANRQYIIAALPALIFGRNIFTLHLGFASLFLIGLTMMFLEFRNWLKLRNLSENLALFPVYAIVAFRFISEYYMNFEQAITPVCLTMMGIALFMKLYRLPNLFTAISLSWVGCFFCDSYTPILASLGLLGIFLLLYIVKIVKDNKELITQEKGNFKKLPLLKVLFGIELNMILFFVATILVKRSDRISETRANVSLISFALESWSEFFSDKNAIFLGVFSGIVILYLFLSLFYKLKLYDIVISCWVLGVILFSNYMVGYTTYEKSWILQRNMIIIPVLVTGIFLAITDILKNHHLTISRGIEVTVTVMLAFLSFCNFGMPHQSFVYFKNIQPMKYMISYSQQLVKEQGLDSEDEFNLLLITDNILQRNVYDYATFFYPNAHAVSTTTTEYLQEFDHELPTIVIGESKESVAVYCNKTTEATYKNPRYKTTAVWYSGILEN